MRRALGIYVAGGWMLVAATVAAAAGPQFNIRTGLWEITVQSETSGQLPMSDEEMRRLTPRQRDAIEQATGLNRGPRTRLIKNCVTQQKLDRDANAFDSPPEGMTCSTKKFSRTSSGASGTLVCSKGNTHLSEEFSYHARDREHVDGRFHMVRSDGAHTVTINGKQSGRWVNSSCGAIR